MFEIYIGAAAAEGFFSCSAARRDWGRPVKALGIESVVLTMIADAVGDRYVNAWID